MLLHVAAAAVCQPTPSGCPERLLAFTSPINSCMVIVVLGSCYSLYVYCCCTKYRLPVGAKDRVDVVGVDVALNYFFSTYVPAMYTTNYSKSTQYVRLPRPSLRPTMWTVDRVASTTAVTAQHKMYSKSMYCSYGSTSHSYTLFVVLLCVVVSGISYFFFFFFFILRRIGKNKA